MRGAPWSTLSSTNGDGRSADGRSTHAEVPDRPLATPSDDPEFAALQTALADLPAGMRAAVVFRHVYDLSVAETADALGCSEGNVKSQTARGLERLRGSALPRFLHDLTQEHPVNDIETILNNAGRPDGHGSDPSVVEADLARGRRALTVRRMRRTGTRSVLVGALAIGSFAVVQNQSGHDKAGTTAAAPTHTVTAPVVRAKRRPRPNRR